MQQPNTIIYITGLSDRNPRWQARIIKLWNWSKGVETEMFHSSWADKQSFESKRDKLLARIDVLAAAGHTVSLVGVSAGASMALTAFALRKEIVSGVVYICGKVNDPRNVAAWRYEENPAFKTAMYQLNDRLRELTKQDRAKILSVYPLYDQVVQVSDTKIKGVKTLRVPTLLHVPSIAVSMTLYSPLILHFLKKQATIHI